MAGRLPDRGFESTPESLTIFSLERDQLAAYRILFTCSALLAAHEGAGGETCMEINYDHESSFHALKATNLKFNRSVF